MGQGISRMGQGIVRVMGGFTPPKNRHAWGEALPAASSII